MRGVPYWLKLNVLLTNKVFVPLDSKSQKIRPIRFTNNRIFGESPTRCIISMTSMEKVQIDALLV